MYIVNALIDFFLPRYCLMCGTRLELQEQTVCIHCNFELPRTRLWLSPTDNRLITRFIGKIPIKKAAAYLYYTPHTATANIIYAFKYHKEPFTALSMGEMMAKEIGHAFFDDIDCIIPIPLNKKREKQRGYNQSERLATGISNVHHIPVLNNIVKRRTDNVTQTSLDASDRQRNIEDIFCLTRHSKKVQGKHCLIVDDVVTTGSTTAGCAEALLNVPGTTVSVLALACIRYDK